MNGAPAEPDSVPPVLGAPGASPLEGAPVAPLERTPAAPAPRTRHWLPAAGARGLALFIGGFTLLSVIGAALTSRGTKGTATHQMLASRASERAAPMTLSRVKPPMNRARPRAPAAGSQ